MQCSATVRLIHLLLSASSVVASVANIEVMAADSVVVNLTVQSPLNYSNTPMDPWINVQELTQQAGARGVADLQSIAVQNMATGQVVPHALSHDFNTGQAGRVEFVISDPAHTQFRITFQTVCERSAPRVDRFISPIGIGDLLRYNAGVPRPVTVPYAPGWIDLTGDGRLDLTGTWNYARRPGRPWDGVVCLPGLSQERPDVGHLHRLRFRSGAGEQLIPLSHRYMGVAFADLNDDGRPDAVVTRRGEGFAEFFLNSGQPEVSGMPTFVSAGRVDVAGWQVTQAVDLNHDGSIDLVIDGQFIENRNPNGWPFEPSDPVRLEAGHRPCFLDVDADGWQDAVCLQEGDGVDSGFYRLAWRRNRRRVPVAFSDEMLLDDIPLTDVSAVGAWNHGARSGLIVQHRAYQRLTLMQLDEATEAPPRSRFRLTGRVESRSAELSLGDQAWPCLCDWDSDGDQDLLVGDGYGWLRILINDGTRTQPSFREPVRLRANGQAIRFLRNELLGQPANSHNMGYCFPVFADWDGDGLRDLICPNETNRLYWFPNVGTAPKPRFAARRQILCDGYPDSPELKSRSNQRASSPRSNNGVYPYEEGRPFFWRTGAAIADFNGDGLTDLITHDGHTRVATLFVQYRDAGGNLRLRKEAPVTLLDGRPINDELVSRRAHWTESFRAVDWNRDGLLDLIYSVAGAHNGTRDGGSIYLLLNTGTEQRPVFAAPKTMRCFGKPIRITNHGPHPWAGDFDGDGLPDLITCVEWSVYPWYAHAALMMEERPQYSIELLDGVK